MNETGRPQDFPLSNPRADRVREVAKLAGRPARLKREQFLVEGPQAVREALKLHQQRLAAGATGVVHEVFASEACLDRYPEFEDLAEGTNARLATEEVLAAMADTVNPQGIIAVCGFVDISLEEVLDAGPRLIAVLCQVRDPGNAGTVLRAADAAGADAVVLTGSSVDIYNPKAVRSTAGSLFHLPVVLGADIEEVAAACRARGSDSWQRTAMGTSTSTRCRTKTPPGECPGPAQRPPISWRIQLPGSSETKPRGSRKLNSRWLTIGWQSPFTARRKASTWVRQPPYACTPAPGPSRAALRLPCRWRQQLKWAGPRIHPGVLTI